MEVAVNLELDREKFANPVFFLDNLGRDELFAIFEAEKVLITLLAFDKFSLNLSQNSKKQYADGKDRLFLLSQIKFILNKAQELGIQPIILKGIACEQSFYPEGVIRNFNDIDLYIKRDDFYLFKEVLEKNGYFAKNLSKKQLQYELKTQHALSFKNKSTGLEIDLHWNLIQIQYGVDTSSVREKELFSNLKTLKLQNFDYQTLSLEQHFYFICLHAYKNLFSNYKDLLDIFFALQVKELDVPKVRELAKGSEMDLILNLSIYLSNKVWGGSSPCYLSKEELKIADKIFNLKIKEKQRSEIEDMKIELSLRKVLLKKVKYLYLRCFIPHEEDWDTKLPESLFFLYKILKPLKFISRALRLAIKN